jgi:pSer/pThr/pTyr-binding forkhead associated (FHA) protein
VPTQDADWEAYEYKYKYSCRKCPIRARCILQSHASPTIKEAMRNAFVNRTDTMQMWGILQENCLFIKEEEEEKEQKTRRESLLSQRLRKAREGVAVQGPAPPPETMPPTIPRTTPPARPPLPPTAPAARGDRVLPPQETTAQVPPPPLPTSVAACCLIVQPSGRRIALPDDGELVLGRFDPDTGLSADVDLRHDDEDRVTVSRRHAKVSGLGGRHTIEDLGSTNGTTVNDSLLELGESVPLKPGDRIKLGGCQLSYEPMPEWIAKLPADAKCCYYLLATATGHRFDLPADAREVIIGRTDPMVGARPDIDLGREGEVSRRVSRRHARLNWEKGSHFLEDLGSSFGIRINGADVRPGDKVRLRPGDHIWLGGCVLAYDLELEQH